MDQWDWFKKPFLLAGETYDESSDARRLLPESPILSLFFPFKRLSCLATCWLSLTLQLEEYKISCCRTSWISWMNISFSIWLSYNLWLNQYHTVSPLNRQCCLKSYVARIYSCFDNCRQIFTRIKCMWVFFSGKECFSDMTFSRKILENFRVAVDVNEQSTFWNMLALLTRLTRSNCKLNGDLQIWLQVYEIE